MTHLLADEPPTTGPAWPLALVIACMMPFVALAVLAAATMPARRAGLTIGTIWAANQLLGFTVLRFPATGYAFAWGAALGIAALAAGLVAGAILRDRRDLSVASMLFAFGAAFVAYEGLLFGFALVAGGLETFKPSIVFRILVNDGLWFAGLSTLWVALTRAAPRWFGPAPALRLA